MNRCKISTIIGCVCFLVTIIIFMLIHPIIMPSTIVALVFMLYAEIVFVGGFWFVEILANKSSGILSRAGVGGIIAIYSIVVFVTSLLYMLYSGFIVRWFIILQMLLFVFVFAIVMVLSSFAKSASVSDLKILQADSTMNNFKADLLMIREKVDDKGVIDKIIEALRFSDSSIIVDCDVEIGEVIARLKEYVDDDEITSDSYKKELEELELLIKKRNLQAKNMKQGGI